MNFFKKNTSGYTLLELTLTISISAFLLVFYCTAQQRQHQKHLAYERYLGEQKECLDFFTKTSLLIATSLRFTQKDTKTFALELAPNKQYPEGRHLEIQLNRQHNIKDTLNISTQHIHEFSWFYWDFQRNEWVKFDLKTPYANKSFIKVILKDKSQKALDTFVYPCYVNTQ